MYMSIITNTIAYIFHTFYIQMGVNIRDIARPIALGWCRKSDSTALQTVLLESPRAFL